MPLQQDTGLGSVRKDWEVVSVVVLENQIVCAFFPQMPAVFFIFSGDQFSCQSSFMGETWSPPSPTLHMSQFKPNREQLSVCVSEFISEQST